MINRDLCITAEKWFASGKSNVFRLVVLLAGQIFETRRSHFSAVSNNANAAVHNFFGCGKGASIPEWQKGLSVRATAPEIPEIKECGGDKMMELGTIVMVDHPKHPFNGCVGKVVGRRGNRTPDDMWILIYFADKMRSYLVPESILSVQKPAPAPSDKPLH